MYVALIQFRDLDGKIYNIGEVYPLGDVTQARIEQLLTSNNRTKAPVIGMVKDSSTLDFNTMSRADLKAYAEENGIDLTNARNNAERIAILQGN